jgi:hypothetical protein
MQTPKTECSPQRQVTRNIVQLYQSSLVARDPEQLRGASRLLTMQDCLRALEVGYLDALEARVPDGSCPFDDDNDEVLLHDEENWLLESSCSSGPFSLTETRTTVITINDDGSKSHSGVSESANICQLHRVS